MPDSSKDPAIKLFGQNIPVPEHVFAAEPPRGVPPYNHDIHATKAVVDECGEAERSEADGAPIQKSSEQDAPDSGKREEMNCRDIVQDGEVQENKKPEHEPAVGSEMKSEQKVLKKPDKIIPCPRCDSMDTKFCYFNNYNVNQPRHFCRNCQRYWTAGGTVRNVPVGSGRRKNKHASSLYHQVVLSPPVVTVAQAEVLNSAGQWHLSGVGAPLSPRPIEGFGAVLNLPTFPYLCQSMATALNLTEHKGKVESSSGSTDNNDEVPKSCGSSSISTDLRENQLLTKEMKQCGVTDRSYGSPPAHPLQLHSGCPLLYPWNPCGNAKAVTPEASNSTPFYMACPPLMLSGFCSPNTAVPVVPVANWNFTPRTPFFPSTSCASPSSSTTSSGCSGDNTPTLGKHSRDTNLQAEKTEKSQWVPKTLRVNDPKDAAKSPKRNRESATKSNMLKALHSRSDFTSRASL